jgi:hypothetical protein
VRLRYAIGSWRLRRTPSFCRRTSQWAFTVLGEMPSRSETSSFEQPAAMRTITSRCRGVMGGTRSTLECVMARGYGVGVARTIGHRV